MIITWIAKQIAQKQGAPVVKDIVKEKNKVTVKRRLPVLTVLLTSMTVMLGLVALPAHAEPKSSSVGVQFGANSGANSIDSKQVMAVTANFYHAYLNYLNPENEGDGTDMSLVQFLQQSGAMDNRFIGKIDAMVQESIQEVGFVEVDPIIWAQDVPLDIKFAPPQIKGDSATMTVYSLWSESGSDKQILLVKLHKLADGWKIYDIVDGGMV